MKIDDFPVCYARKNFQRVTTNLGQMMVSQWWVLEANWLPSHGGSYGSHGAVKTEMVRLGLFWGYPLVMSKDGRMLGGCWEDGFELSVWCYPLVMSKLLKMAIETVHLPIRHGGSFQYPQRKPSRFTYPRAQDSPGVGLSWRHRVYCLHMGTWPNNVPIGYIQLVLSQEKRTIL